jgi:hypothetical protein
MPRFRKKGTAIPRTMRRKAHPKFGHVCMCDCHKDGEDIREDGVLVIKDFNLVTVSLVSEDQLVDPHCRIREEEK